MISGSLQGDVVVTTNNAAAAWRARTSVTFTGLAVLFGIVLAGCSTTGPSLIPGVETTAQTAPAAANTATQVAIAPIIGAPDQVASQLKTHLTNSLSSRSIGVAEASGAKYTLRGYVVSAREKTGTKVSYIWDVTDPTGKRVHRISGEEIAAAGNSRDPWAAVTPAVMTAICDKTATSLAGWLPSNSAAAPAVANAAQAAPAAAAASKPVQQANAAALGTTTGSIGHGLSAIVPSVSGAPGDGSVSLTRAIRSELSRNGVALANTASPQSYRVEGQVALKPANGGKQEINIDWHVKDPSGKKLGTVSQKNAIPAGSLDGAWGKTADAAAAAAAQGILKLLPDSQTKTN
jgi:hypothetical protein